MLPVLFACRVIARMVVFFTEEAPKYVLVLSNTEAILLVGKTTNPKLVITRLDKTIDWTARATYPRGEAYTSQAT